MIAALLNVPYYTVQRHKMSVFFANFVPSLLRGKIEPQEHKGYTKGNLWYGIYWRSLIIILLLTVSSPYFFRNRIADETSAAIAKSYVHTPRMITPCR